MLIVLMADCASFEYLISYHNVLHIVVVSTTRATFH